VERKARHNNSVAKHPGKRIQVVLYNKLPFTHFDHFISFSIWWGFGCGNSIVKFWLIFTVVCFIIIWIFEERRTGG